MFRKIFLAATLAAGAFAAAPAPASAQVYLGIGGPGYYRGYDRGPRYRHYRGYDRPYYRPRPYGFYDGPRYRPRCRLVTRRYWDGYGYVRRTREVCGRRW
jgi:hypothetical protein